MKKPISKIVALVAAIAVVVAVTIAGVAVARESAVNLQAMHSGYTNHMAGGGHMNDGNMMNNTTTGNHMSGGNMMGNLTADDQACPYYANP